MALLTKPILISLLFAPLISSASAIEPTKELTSISTETFYKMPARSEVRLSPDGDKLALIIPINGRRSLAVYDLALKQTTTIASDPEWDFIKTS